MKHIRHDPSSRIEAKAALLALAHKDPEVADAIEASGWEPPEAVIEGSRKMVGIGKKRFWQKRNRGSNARG